jgi:aminopeptidase C
MTLSKLNDQRFMVSPCGSMSDWFDVNDIADEAPGWFDCTAAEMSDAEIGQLMQRRMYEHDRLTRQYADEDRAERAQWHRSLDALVWP